MPRLMVSHTAKGSQPRTTPLPVPRSTLHTTRCVTVAVLQPTFSVTVGATDAVLLSAFCPLLSRAVHSFCQGKPALRRILQEQFFPRRTRLPSPTLMPRLFCHHRHRFPPVHRALPHRVCRRHRVPHLRRFPAHVHHRRMSCQLHLRRHRCLVTLWIPVRQVQFRRFHHLHRELSPGRCPFLIARLLICTIHLHGPTGSARLFCCRNPGRQCTYLPCRLLLHGLFS